MADPTPTPASPSGPRSGCSLALGVSLVAIGLLFLVQNFYSYSLVGTLRAGLRIFGDYWPVLLVIWGAFKIYRHVTTPHKARVSAFEIFLLFIIIGSGLTIRAARRVMDRLGAENPIDELFSIAGVDVLRGPAHRFTEETSYDLAPGGSFRFDSPRSNVRISGWDEARLSVVVTKLVHDPSADEAARIASEVELRFDDSDVAASSPSAEAPEAPKAEDPGSSGSRQAKLTLIPARNPGSVDVDVELRLPRTATVSVHNRGRVEVSDLEGPVEIETAEEAIEAHNVKGGLKATTRHGDMRVENASGNLELQNRDGEIRVNDLDGDLKADTSHGAIQAEEVTGRAVIGNRRGSIHLSRIGGRVEIKAEHSEVSVETAKENVSITTTHQPIFVRGVDGDLTLDATGSAIQALEVRGNVAVSDVGEPVTIAKVRGSLTVKCRESRVTTDEIEGPLTIETSNEDVRVGDFGSSLSVHSTHSAIDAGTNRLHGNISLQTSYGEVDLRLPPDVAVRARVSTRDGDVTSGIPGLELQAAARNDGRLWSGTLGAGTYEVTIDTSYGDVRIGVPES